MSLLFASVRARRRRRVRRWRHLRVRIGLRRRLDALSVAATALQWALERSALLSPMLASSSHWLGACLLFATGLHQWTPWKSACLDHCRAPAGFLAAHWRPGAAGAFRMGALHGAYCLGCCWLLMGLLFFGGVMNLLWVAGLTLLVLLEKLMPRGDLLARAAGVALIVAGGAQLVRALAGA